MYSAFPILFAGIVLVPTHILLSVCGDTETDSDTFISKVIATIKQGQFTATITEDEEPMPPKFLTDIQDAEVS